MYRHHKDSFQLVCYYTTNMAYVYDRNCTCFTIFGLFRVHKQKTICLPSSRSVNALHTSCIQCSSGLENTPFHCRSTLFSGHKCNIPNPQSLGFCLERLIHYALSGLTHLYTHSSVHLCAQKMNALPDDIIGLMLRLRTFSALIRLMLLCSHTFFSPFKYFNMLHKIKAATTSHVQSPWEIKEKTELPVSRSKRVRHALQTHKRHANAIKICGQGRISHSYTQTCTLTFIVCLLSAFSCACALKLLGGK